MFDQTVILPKGPDSIHARCYDAIIRVHPNDAGVVNDAVDLDSK